MNMGRFLGNKLLRDTSGCELEICVVGNELMDRRVFTDVALQRCAGYIREHISDLTTDEYFSLTTKNDNYQINTIDDLMIVR